MNHLPIRNVLCGIVGGAMALVAATTAHAGDNNTNPQATASNQNPAPVGMVVAKDPETGALVMPSPEQMAALAKQQPAEQGKKQTKAGAAQTEFRLPNGTVITTLDGSTDVFELAVKKDDGKVVTACVPGYKVDATLKAAQEGKMTKKEVLDEK